MTSAPKPGSKAAELLGTGPQSGSTPRRDDLSGISLKAATVLGVAAASFSPAHLLDNPMAKLLTATPLHDIVPEQVVVSLRDSDSLGACVEAISKNNISSVPITTKGACVGFVDLLDVARYIVSHAPDSSTVTESALTNFAHQLFYHTPASTVLNSDRQTLFVAMDSKEPASSAADVFARGVHRVAVYTSSDAKDGAKIARFSGVLSQSDLVAWLAKHTSKDMSTEMREMLNEPIFGLQGRGLNPQALWKSGDSKETHAGNMVLCISQNATVLKALEKLVMTSARCLAVVNDGGELTGNFSISDLEPCFARKKDKHGAGSHVSESGIVSGLFFAKVLDYLKHHRPLSLQAVVEQNPEAKFGFVLRRMADEELHHIWLLNKGDKRPAGIITLTDIMRVVCIYQKPLPVAPVQTYVMVTCWSSTRSPTVVRAEQESELNRIDAARKADALEAAEQSRRVADDAAEVAAAERMSKYNRRKSQETADALETEEQLRRISEQAEEKRKAQLETDAERKKALEAVDKAEEVERQRRILAGIDAMNQGAVMDVPVQLGHVVSGSAGLSSSTATATKS